jgi:hypothetical protein
VHILHPVKSTYAKDVDANCGKWKGQIAGSEYSRARAQFPFIAALLFIFYFRISPSGAQVLSRERHPSRVNTHARNTYA